MQIKFASKIAKLDTNHPPLQIAEAAQGFGVEAQYPVADLFNQWREQWRHILINNLKAAADERR
jgi:hypothetical protein